MINIQQKPMTVERYKNLTESTKYKTPNHVDYADLEKKFWTDIVTHSPIYGADVNGSITDKDVNVCVYNFVFFVSLNSYLCKHDIFS